MLSPEKVAEVEHLLAETLLSYREIASCTGVSRATVGSINHGQWCQGGTGRLNLAWQGVEPPGQRFEKCPTCHHVVQAPCLACQLHAAGFVVDVV